MRHHVILISVDALRADRLGCYGDPRNLTPALDELAAEAVVFLQATSPSTWTLPGHMSMLSGLEPPVHGCVSSRHRYPPERLPFPLAFELLAPRGYAPQGVVGGGFMEPQFGFGRAENYVIIHPIGEATLQVVFHVASNQRSFSFLHTYMVHDYPRVDTQAYTSRFVDQWDPPYQGYFPHGQDLTAMIKALALAAAPPRLPQRDVAYVQDLYYANVAAMDFAMRMLFKRLRDRGFWDETTLIFTSDHGTSLGEEHNGHQHWFHAGPPYQEQIRVPLIIKPAQHLAHLFEPPQLVDEPVSLIDILPTLLELTGANYDRSQLDGRSLLGLCQGDRDPFRDRRLFFHTHADLHNGLLAERLHGTAMTWREGTKVFSSTMEGVVRELYWLEFDPHERHNRLHELAPAELDEVDAALEGYWASVMRRAREPRAEAFEDPELVQRLTALGYLD